MPNSKLTIFFVGLGVYLIMNIIAFAAMGLDKRAAKAQAYRTPERMLFLWAALFGGVGGTMGMYTFRHKTKHWYFKLFFPLLAVLQIAALIWGTSALLIA